MDESLLKEIGLTNSEVKVYLALLQLGDSTRGKLVAQSKIAGSKIYDILEKLQEKGLVSVYISNKVKHFKPIDPKQILSYLATKKQQIMQVEEKVNEQMPQLLALFNQKREEQEVELLSGLEGINIVFTQQVEILEKEDECFVIGGTKGSDETAVVAFFEKIHLLREQKGIHTKMLFNINQKESTHEHYSSKKFPHTTTKYITHSSPVAINIYSEYTVIIIFGQKITAMKIKSKDVAQSFREYFNLLWNTALN